MVSKKTVIQLLIDSKMALTEQEANHWFENEKIPSMNGKTAAELFTEGHGDAVILFIKRIADGGYA
jgi:hypothetical protein